MIIKSKCVFELCNLVHRLENRATGEHFTIHVENDIKLQSQDFVGLLGPSGCGKTTLLTILGLLRSPSDLSELSAFRIHVPESVNGERTSIDIKEAWAKKRFGLIEKIRREHVGFALQSGELINSLTVGENIKAPLRLNGWSVAESEARLSELLELFNLFRGAADDSETVRQRNLSRARINRLSGGEYQRVALARSIAHRPSVVFVDEPTSALNRQLAFDALNTLKMNQVSQEKAGVTFMITHDEGLADEFCNVLIRMAPCKGRPAGEVVEVVRKSESGESSD